MAKVWDQAMTVHGMFRQSIDACQREVRLEIEELVDEHIDLVRERAEAGFPVAGLRVDAEPAAAQEDERRYALIRTSGADPIPLRDKRV